VLQSLSFRMGFGPRNANDFGKKHFGKLMAKHEFLGDLVALGGEKDMPAPLNLNVAVARHALDRSGDSGRSDVKLFGETSTDRDLVFLTHLPDGLEVIFLRNAGFLAAHRVSGKTKG